MHKLVELLYYFNFVFIFLGCFIVCLKFAYIDKYVRVSYGVCGVLVIFVL